MPITAIYFIRICYVCNLYLPHWL